MTRRVGFGKRTSGPARPETAPRRESAPAATAPQPMIEAPETASSAAAEDPPRGRMFGGARGRARRAALLCLALLALAQLGGVAGLQDLLARAGEGDVAVKELLRLVFLPSVAAGLIFYFTQDLDAGDPAPDRAKGARRAAPRPSGPVGTAFSAVSALFRSVTIVFRAGRLLLLTGLIAYLAWTLTGSALGDAGSITLLGVGLAFAVFNWAGAARRLQDSLAPPDRGGD